MALEDTEVKPGSPIFNQYPMDLGAFRTVLDIMERTFPDKVITASVVERMRPSNGSASITVQFSLNPREDPGDGQAPA